MTITKVSPDLLDLDAGITISVADNSDNLTLTSTDDDANSGPNLRLYRNSSSPADDDVVGVIDFEGRNNNSQDVIYANIQGEIMQEADGSEDGQLQFGVMKAGTLRNAFMIDRTEVAINEDSVDIDFRVESDAYTHALFVQGSSGSVGIGDSSPDARLKVNSTGGGSELAFKVADASDNSVFEVQGGGTAVFQYGHVGIANTSPGSYDSNARNLVVGSGSGDEGMSIASGSGSSGRLYFADGTSSDGEKADGYILYNHASTYMAFGTNGGTEAMRIDSNGRLIIGLTSSIDATNLTVQSNGGNGLAIGSADSANAYRHIYHTTSSGILSFASSSNTASLSNAGAWTNASDVAYKKDIVDTQYGLNTIKTLQPRDYKLKADDTEHTGFIAQELETVLPQFVIGEEGHKNVNYAQITAVLTKAIQELTTKLEAAEARITTLEG